MGGLSLEQQVALLTEEERAQFLAGLDPDILRQIASGEWWWVSRPEQVPPDSDWSIFLFLAGRGTGKTRAGSEWLAERTIRYPYDTSGFPVERLVMGYNLSDTRTVCIEGASGILRVLQRLGYKEHPAGRIIPDDGSKLYTYTKSPKPHIKLLDTGATIHFTGSDPDAARGFNLGDVWMDEPCKWPDASAAWAEGIRPALRVDLPGDKPRAFVTTTPKPIVLLQDWVRNKDERKVYISRGSTFDNAANLSEDALNELRAMYEGTALGRQELYGELLDDVTGALFSYLAIEEARVTIGPERVAHRTVGVDPGLTGAEGGDEMGVIVACRDYEDHMYVVADETTKLAGRDAALHAWRVFERYQADTLVYEENLGKQWMKDVFTDAFKELQRAGVFPAEVVNPPLKPVWSQHGKKLRAEVVAMRYSQRRVHHIGHFQKLEDQMLAFDPISSKSSPDRLDALVHACRHLIEGESRRSRIMSPRTLRISALDVGQMPLPPTGPQW